MASPRQHIFGLGLTLEVGGGAAHQNGDSLGLFDDIYDIGAGCGDINPECQGTERVSFNQNTDINSQTQPPISNETPRVLVSKSPDIQQQPAIINESPIIPFNNSLSLQQQPFTGNGPMRSPINNYNTCGTRQQPIIIQETPEFNSSSSWDSQDQQPTNGSKPLLGDLFIDLWDLPSPTDPLWSQFPRLSPQAQVNNGISNHETNLNAYSEHNSGPGPIQTGANNGAGNDEINLGPCRERNPGQLLFQNQIDTSTVNYETNLGAYGKHNSEQHPIQTQVNNDTRDHEMGFDGTNEYGAAFSGRVPITYTQTSYVNQDPSHATRPEEGNSHPINQYISNDAINRLSEQHPIRQYLAEFSRQPQVSLKRAVDGEHDPLSKDTLIFQTTPAKRLKTNNSNAAPRPRKVNVKDGKVNPRTARRIELDPTQYYESLKQTPQSWGTISPDGRHRFRYNGFGELKPGMTFTSDEMLEYLYGTFPRSDNVEPDNPSLFIQCVPSDSNSRYPTTLSNKCRFTDCPVKMRTIPSGHFRVAFDEQNNEKLDPYHCAGYVHLYCLERFYSFSCLAQYCNLVPDTRVLREGRNRMSITRDHSGFARLCMVYMEDCRHRDPQANGWEYKNTLCSLLTEEYLRLEARVRRATRERQGGNNIGVHRNDMELYAWGQDHMVLLRSIEAQNNPKKRKRLFDEDDGNDDYEHGG
ncbi:hypothetical protein V491_05300 [Pseudogymnoascus sp. VKM F-3775]|nr:hypothetical protein V491_05300 [Pseudogymnoascus sp. VKM F-3775]